MAAKPLFKVTLNYLGNVHTYHKYANGESHALRLACLDLADEANTNLMPILNYYLSNRKDNYSVEMVKPKERR